MQLLLENSALAVQDEALPGIVEQTMTEKHTAGTPAADRCKSRNAATMVVDSLMRAHYRCVAQVEIGKDHHCLIAVVKVQLYVAAPVAMRL